MKILLFLTIFLVGTTVYGQSEALSGKYEQTYNNDQGIISYQISLNPDGTFIFHLYDRNISLTPDKTNERNKYGKGTWKSEKNLVFFYADTENDFDETYTLDFSKTKARFITKSPRDKSNRVIKTAILFYESDIFYVNGWKLFKQ